MQFTAENEKEFERILSHYPQKRAALLQTLYLVQEQEGYISMEAIRWIAGLLGVEPVEVYAVITFYTMLKLKPTGRFHLQLCTNVSCMLLGGERLLNHLKNKLGIKPGEMTPDGHFTLSTVECLGSCGTAPVMQVNQEAYNEELDVEKLDRLIEELRAQAESQGEAKA